MAALFAFAFLVRSALWVVAGTRHGGDTASYLAACSNLIQEPSGLVRDLVGWEYLGFLVPLCVSTLGGAVPEMWIAVQILISSAIPVLLVGIAAALGNRGAGWLAGLAYAVLPEAFQWDLYILSDAWFTFMLTLSFWLLVRTQETPRWAAPVALFVLAVSRPFGIPIVAAMILLHAITGRFQSIGLNQKGAWAAVVALPIIQQLLSWRRGWSDSLFPSLWQEGYVIHDDATLLLPSDAQADSALGFVLADPLHFILLAAAKVGVFFLPIWPRYSFIHNAVGLVTLAPIVFLGLWGLWRACRSQNSAGLLAATIVAATTFIVAITFIDYDWRYRLPLLPLFTLFAALIVFPSPNQAWPRAGGWASKPLQKIGTPDTHVEALHGVSKSMTWDELEETAVPSYVHPNPLVRWLFGRRVQVAMNMLGTTPKRVLDIGCGGGLFVAAAHRQGHEATGIDLDIRAAEASNLPDAITIMEGDATDLPFEDHQFDTVVAMDVLEHLTDLSPFVAQAQRVLAPGGNLLLSGPSESLLYRLARRVAGYEGHYHHTNIKSILKTFESHGWTVTRTRHLPLAIGLFTVASLEPPEAA